MTDPRPTLVADIGATNARFGLMDGNHLRETRTLRGADHPTIEAAAEAFLAAVGVGRLRPERAAFAVAGPVTGDRVALTNLPWAFSVDAVRSALGLDRLVVINDFTAVAMSVPRLGRDDVRAVGEGVGDGVADPAGVVGVIGPGSGLGVSGLVPAAGGGWSALSGEGGHVTMAPVGDREGAILAQLRKSFDHVSAERVLSGPGLVNLYNALRVLDGREPEPLTPADVTARGLDRSDAHCVEAVETFCAMLGTVAGNLALTLGARGGVYIAGGIVPKLGPTFLHSRFRKRFVEKGRMRAFLTPIPTFVITHPLPAFLGLVEVLERG